MKRKSIIKLAGTAFLSAFAMSGAFAAPLSPGEAIARIQSSSHRLKMVGDSNLKLVYTANAGDVNTLYVFNSGANGFVVTSADDRLPAVLGYSDSGNFDDSNVSPELKWWLSQYSDEVVLYLSGEADFQPLTAMNSSERQSIPSLISTKWNQGYPFNEACPMTAHGRSVTGCVATAMAQVLNFYKYPVSGLGNHTYDWNGTPLSFDFENKVFAWNDMLDIYDVNAGSEQCAAVADLMFACGVSVDMDYSSDESAASEMYMANALKKYFNYDKGLKYLKRQFYTNEEWDDIIYSELVSGRPVLYGGRTTNDGGHQFICDGYEDGYYHINWGWGGHGDGYYLLSALDPGTQGIGGSNGAYNSDQAAVVGVLPDTGNTDVWYPIYANSGISGSLEGNDKVRISFSSGGVFNYSPEAVTVDCLLKIVSDQGAEYYSLSGNTLSFEGAEGLRVKGFSAFSLSYPSGIPEGKYKAYVVFRTPEGNIQPVLGPVTASCYLNFIVDSNGRVQISSGVPVEKAEIKVTEFSPSSQVLSGVSVSYTMTITNVSEVEYGDRITVKLFERGSDTELQSKLIGVNVPAGKTIRGTVPIAWTVTDGDYDLRCFDIYGDPVSDVIQLKIGDDNAVDLLTTAECADIYTLNGVILKRNADREYVETLEKGIYIFIVGGKAHKIIKN